MMPNVKGVISLFVLYDRVEDRSSLIYVILRVYCSRGSLLRENQSVIFIHNEYIAK